MKLDILDQYQELYKAYKKAKLILETKGKYEDVKLTDYLTIKQLFESNKEATTLIEDNLEELLKKLEYEIPENKIITCAGEKIYKNEYNAIHRIAENLFIQNLYDLYGTKKIKTTNNHCTYLSLKNANIISLKPLKELEYLEELDLRYATIKNIAEPLDELKKLKKLYLTTDQKLNKDILKIRKNIKIIYEDKNLEERVRIRQNRITNKIRYNTYKKRN